MKADASPSSAVMLNGLGLIKLSREQQIAQGQVQLHRFARFCADQPEQSSTAVLRWMLEGQAAAQHHDSAAHAVVITGNANASMACQRCLGVLEQEIRFETKLLLVRSEQEAQRIESIQEQLGEYDTETLVLEDDFDFQTFLEDELIMATPFAPMHTTCPDQVEATPLGVEANTALAQIAAPGSYTSAPEPTRKSLANLGAMIKRKQ